MAGMDCGNLELIYSGGHAECSPKLFGGLEAVAA
jgi:hypothetical protein